LKKVLFTTINSRVQVRIKEKKMNYLLNHKAEVIIIFLKLINKLDLFISNNLLLNILRVNKYL